MSSRCVSCRSGRGKVDLKLVRTQEMYADCMTKLVDLATFQRCRSVLLNLPAAGL